jgi:hypothetical protein
MIGCDTPTQRSQTSHRRPGPSSKMRSECFRQVLLGGRGQRSPAATPWVVLT